MGKKNLFFSFYYKDKEYYQKLREMLEQRDYFNFAVLEIPENEAENEDYIMKIIRPRIDHASIVIVIISPGTYTRKWVNWEIEYAASKGKRVVGVYHWGEAYSKKPAALSRLYDEDYEELALVRWNSESIVSAIRGENIWDEGETQNRGCFIATAAYGTSMAEEILVLKKWRDEKLILSVVGKILIILYYSVSPPIARYISISNYRKKFIRKLLRPLICKLKKS